MEPPRTELTGIKTDFIRHQHLGEIHAHLAAVLGLGPKPGSATPLVVQVARWMRDTFRLGLHLQHEAGVHYVALVYLNPAPAAATSAAATPAAATPAAAVPAAVGPAAAGPAAAVPAAVAAGPAKPYAVYAGSAVGKTSGKAMNGRNTLRNKSIETGNSSDALASCLRDLIARGLQGSIEVHYHYLAVDHVNELPTFGGAVGIVRAMESETLDNFQEGLINVRSSFLDRAGFSTEDARHAGLISSHCRMSFDTTNEAVAQEFATSEILTGRARRRGARRGRQGPDPHPKHPPTCLRFSA